MLSIALNIKYKADKKRKKYLQYTESEILIISFTDELL